MMESLETLKYKAKEKSLIKIQGIFLKETFLRIKKMEKQK